ncbi:hypothetical protein PG989_007447 [Apiospora arundinis]
MSFFPLLPAELRIAIWEAALDAEAEALIVPFYRWSPNVWAWDALVPPKYYWSAIPQKRLASPLLSTCRESRRLAFKFYPMKLAIFRVPTYHIRIPEVCDELHWKVEMEVLDRLKNMKTRGERAGTLYLSPQHDRFLVGVDFTVNFTHIPSANQSHGIQSPTSCVSAALTTTDYRQFRNIVLAENPSMPVFKKVGALRHKYDEECKYYDDDLWTHGDFSNIASYSHCWLVRQPNVQRPRPRIVWSQLDADDFFLYMGPTDSADKLNIQQWTRASVWHTVFETDGTKLHYKNSAVFDAQRRNELRHAVRNDPATWRARQDDRYLQPGSPYDLRLSESASEDLSEPPYINDDEGNN